jgi:ankyrin repeat protein
LERADLAAFEPDKPMKTESVFGLRREAERHAALGRHNRPPKAVSPPRSATAVQNLASLLLCVFALMPLGLRAATNDLSAALRQGLFEEEANRNLDAAIASYQSLAAQFDQDRQVAATAIFRLGECYRKLGRTNDAVGQYQRILREFADQSTLVTLSRQNLTGLGVESQPRFQQRLAAIIQRNPQDSTASTVTGSAARAAEMEAEAASLKVQIEHLSGLNREGARVAVQQNFPNPVLTKLMQDLAEAEQQLAGLTNDYAPTDLHIIRATSQMKAINAQIDAQVDGEIKGLRAKMEADLSAAKALRDKSGSASAAQAQAGAVVIDEEETEIRRIRAMIQNSPDLINAPSGGDKLTPLNTAAYKGQLRVAAFLLANGADVNFKSNDSAPLHRAAGQGHRAMVELLLAKGADVNTRGYFDKTPLHFAADNGFQSVAEALLAGKADVNARDKDQETPLHLAAKKGHSAMVAFLLAHQADPNAQDKTGRTPVSLAAQAGPAETVNKLLAAGARPDLEDSGGRTPLSYAADNGHLDSVKALLAAQANPNAGRGVQPLSLAIHHKDLAMATLLLDAGADANRVSPIDWVFNFANYYYGPNSARPDVSPLILAIAERNADAVKLLLQYKANPNGTGPSGLPVIFSMMDQPEVIKAFLEAGANPNSVGELGESPLMAAVGNSYHKTPEENLAVAKLILARGADVNARNRKGDTALQWAVGISNVPVIKWLLEQKADLNAQNEAGYTPLHRAVWSQNIPAVELLLAKKAAVNVRDKGGRTPLDLANRAENGVREQEPGNYGGTMISANRETAHTMAALLRQYGALDDLPDFNSITACRPSANLTSAVFRKGTNNWNRFTLLELIGQQYGFVSTDSDPVFRPSPFNNIYDWNKMDLRFPELRLVKIHRVVNGSSRRQIIEVDVDALLQSGDCRRDVALEWGDRVEITEADHPVSLDWPGLDTNQIANLAKCVTRNVTVIVKGVTNSVAVGPYFRPANIFTRPGFNPDVRKPMTPGVEFSRPPEDGPNQYSMQKAAGRFMLTAVLRGSGLLRASSDLARVKVVRRDPQTGKQLEWVVDCRGNNNPDLWLRDGDVIEVPEK